MINPLFEFKNRVSAFKRAALKAKKMMQINERQHYPEMDTFLPDEIRVLRENQEYFYIETKMTVESFLEILHLQHEVKEEAESFKTPMLVLSGG